MLNNLTDINRATRLAASALQARIALYMGDWVNAETFSTEYITGVPLSPRASFPAIWTDGNVNEQAIKIETGNDVPEGKKKAGYCHCLSFGLERWPDLCHLAKRNEKKEL